MKDTDKTKNIWEMGFQKSGDKEEQTIGNIKSRS